MLENISNLIIIGFILSALIGLIPIVNPAFAESWYPGQGLKQGDHFEYSVCYTDWHNCTPLQIDFWVKNKTSDGTGWNMEFLAVDGSIVQKGLVTIGMVTPDPMYSDQTISDYASVYKNTISWLDSCSTRDTPKDFSLPAWCRTGGVGGQPVSPEGQEQVTVQAGSYKAWVIGWHKGVDSKIWVVPSIPFPVKAQVYADVTNPPIPPQYIFELAKMENTQVEPEIFKTPISVPPEINPNCSIADMQQDSVHDSATTDTGSMIIEYRYSPSIPKQGCPIEFRISFEKNFDPSQKYSNVHYDVFTVNDKGQKLSSEAQDLGRPDLFAPVGDDDRTFLIKEAPPITHYIINVSGMDSQEGNLDTSVSGLVKIDIHTAAIPEFGSLVTMILAVSIFTIIIVSTRSKLQFFLK